eukprot:SAG11_NODE_3970_length_2128_cov_1.975850_1_plen_96_part_00
MAWRGGLLGVAWRGGLLGVAWRPPRCGARLIPAGLLAIMGRLDGKVALITGAARGQGLVESHLFAAEGAYVFMSDIVDVESGSELPAGATFIRHE